MLAWELSNTFDSSFCVATLLESRGIQINIDGKGRALDNLFIERLWRSVKYEEIYLKNYVNVAASTVA